MTDLESLSDASLPGFRSLMRQAGRIAILIAQVDPDGIGSALVLLHVLETLGVETRVFYAGHFGHPQSEKMWTLFRLKHLFRPMNERPNDWPTALVDSSDPRDARLGDGVDLSPICIIDHHEGERRIERDRFWYVRPCGAASSLALELAVRLDIALGERTMTAAAVGIYADSDGLTHKNTTWLDRKMFMRAMEGGDQHLFSDATTFRMTERQCAMIGALLTNRRFVGRVLVAHPNERLAPHEGELLSIAADQLIRHEDAQFVLAWAFVGDEVVVKARSADTEAPLGAMLRALFGARSGAKAGSGGAHLPAGHLIPHAHADTAIRTFQDDLEARLTTHLSFIADPL